MSHPRGLRGKDIGLYYARRGGGGGGGGGPKLSPEERSKRKLLRRLEDRDQERVLIGPLVRKEIGKLWVTREDPMLRNDALKSRSVARYVPPAMRNAQASQSVSIDEPVAPKRTVTGGNGGPMLEARKRLPAWEHQDRVVAAVRNSSAIVISGETGCGKTTQVPQFIMDHSETDVNIICTQPRRISAVSVAERVANERGCSLGDEVGYQIRLESKSSNDTKLLFCTTGILLRRLQSDPELVGVTHVVVDEIHERTLDADFLLIILRDLLMKKKTNLKLVLMSATLNAEMFAEYFGGCPTVHIPGFTFPVKQYFLEDIVDMTRYSFPHPSGGGRSRNGRGPGKDKTSASRTLEDVVADLEVKLNAPPRVFSRETLQSIAHASFDDNIPLELIETLLAKIDNLGIEGAVLIFLPGWDDISKLCDRLKVSARFGDTSRYSVLPLHSSLPTVNQRQIFDRPPRGVRKIIASTNIAETSITIDDVVFVIDSGKFKEKTYDPATNVSCLLPALVSKASARQRRGRAGRVQEGYCYHLFSSVDHEGMEDYQLPEMLRTPLESLCLQVKALNLGKVKDFLGKALQSPDEQAIDNALELLRIIGALRTDREELTNLGKHLANFPIDPRLGKMLIYAVMFRCLDPILTIAASLGFRNPFVMPLNRKEEADECKARFSAGLQSDHGAYLSAFCQWREAGGPQRGSSFAWKNFLSHSSLGMIDEMKGQFLRLLKETGFVDATSERQDYDRNSKSWPLLCAVLTAGLYPNVARIDFGRKRLKISTKNDGKVKSHPGSVNKFNASFAHHWMIFYEKVRSSDLFILDSTAVPPMALCLFGGRLKANDNRIVVDTGDDRLGMGASIAKVGAHIPFLSYVGTDAETVQLVIRLRKMIDDMASAFLDDPSKARRSMRWEHVMACVVNAVEESASNRYHCAIIYDQAGGEDADEDEDEDEDEPDRRHRADRGSREWDEGSARRGQRRDYKGSQYSRDGPRGRYR